MFLARSIASFTDALPRMSSSSGFEGLLGIASIKSEKVSNPPEACSPPLSDLVANFFASARLSAIASLILSGVGAGSFCTGGGGLGVDLVRIRGLGTGAAKRDLTDVTGEELDSFFAAFVVDLVRIRGVVEPGTASRDLATDSVDLLGVRVDGGWGIRDIS